ncbi:MAG TPA: sulfatase-like hydrolase/transferase, partial [Chloroflexota bacterium]|nr:sulfatase-like hydrolase/transferase [Chloroflexota bacterium]
ADDQAEAAALAYLRDPARRERPFALCVGFIAPHFPLIVPEPYFLRYYPERTDLPARPDGRDEEPTLATRRLQIAYGYQQDHTDEEIRRARAAYYGLVSYVDAKLGRLLDCLTECGLAENTVVVHTSDHGEMLGEHALWGKSCFYEQSARVPLQIAGPGIGSGVRVCQAVSLIDVVATVLDLAGLSANERNAWQLDGESLLPALRGEPDTLKDQVFAEYTARGTDRGRAMLRTSRWKLCYGHGEPPEIELYDLENDPGEFTNLAGQSIYRDVQSDLLARIFAEWDPQEITTAATRSQRARKLIRTAQSGGEFIF